MTNERQQDEAAVTDRVEDVVRAAAVLAARGAELSATRHRQDVRRAARAGAAAAAMIVAFGSAFVFANWAAEQALSSSLASWRAPLVLAGAWLLVAVASAVVLLRLEPGLRRLGRSPDDPAAVLAEQQAAFDGAQADLRDALEHLAGVISEAARREIAQAVLPDVLIDVGDDLVDATEEAFDEIDEVTDAMEARFPVSGIVNRAVDTALVPGRMGVRAARMVVSFRPQGQGPPPKK